MDGSDYSLLSGEKNLLKSDGVYLLICAIKSEI